MPIAAMMMMMTTMLLLLMVMMMIGVPTDLETQGIQIMES